MIGAVVKACESSKRLTDDCENFATCVMQMEEILLENEIHLGDCEETVQKLATILQDAMMFISKLQTKSYVKQVLSSEQSILKFTAMRNRMLDLLQVVDLKLTSNLHKIAQTKFKNEQKLNVMLMNDDFDMNEAEKYLSGSEKVILKSNLDNQKLMRQSTETLQKHKFNYLLWK